MPFLLDYFYAVGNSNNSNFSANLITKHFIKESVVIVVFAYLICLPFLFTKKSVQKSYFLLLFVSLYLASILDFLHLLVFKAKANSSSYYSIFSSNQNETIEFITDYASLNLLLGTAAFAVLPVVIYWCFKKGSSPLIQKVIYWSATMVFGMAAVVFISRVETKSIKAISIYQFYLNYTAYQQEIKQLNNNEKTLSLLKVTHPKIDNNETYVIVIGESTSKFHMQLYGYHRNTTPELVKLKKELTVFNEAKSDHVHTVAAIKDMLLLSDKEEKITPYTLIDCANNAGFQTYWLSNQHYVGENETIVSSIAKKAKKQVFINAAGGKKLDGDLLPEMDNILNDKPKKKLIFVHLMGTHLNYHDRYPSNFNVFNASNISPFGEHADSYINQYDNAILYNDFVVAQLIQQLKSTKGINAMIYTSDHGDEVYDFRNFHGHSQSLESKYMNSVPFILWTNAPFQQLPSSEMLTAKNNVALNFSLANFSNSMQGLFNLKSQLYDSSKSIFSDAYANQATINNALPILEIPEMPVQFSSKIWVHRVNSIERLNNIQDKFAGMELDVVFENGKFDVRHPPAQTSGLSLAQFLSNVKNIQSHYFWLDLKNLTQKNEQAAIKRLDELSKKFNVKAQLIVETQHYKSIPALNKSGYFSSYYLPDFSNTTENGLQFPIQIVRKSIIENQPTSISQDINNYKVMTEHFKNQHKLIWALNLNWNDPKTHQRIEQLLQNDSTIKVCLVNFETDGRK